MPSERMAPDTILTQTGLTGTVSAIQDDPDSPDGSWLTAPGSNTNTVCHVSFGTPTDTLDDTSNAQEFRVRVRKTSHSTNPTAVVELYVNGSFHSTIVSSTTITSTSGQTLSGTWTSSGITAANVECRVAGTVGGGSPGNRASVEVGAIEWNASTVTSGGSDIEFVAERGTDNNNGTTSSYTITPTGTFTAGNKAIITGRFCPAAASDTTVTVTDTNGNTWTTDSIYRENFQILWMASTNQDGGVLNATDTITVTFSQARSSNTPTISWLLEFSGVAESSYDDGQNQAAGSGTNLSTGGVTPTANGDLMIGFIDVQSQSATVTSNASGTVGTYSEPTTSQIDSSGVGTVRRCRVVYQIVSGGSGVSQQHNWALSSSQWSDRLIGAYKKGTSAPTLQSSVGVLWC